MRLKPVVLQKSAMEIKGAVLYRRLLGTQEVLGRTLRVMVKLQGPVVRWPGS